jgi:uncharacterized protein (TIGR03435 family)
MFTNLGLTNARLIVLILLIVKLRYYLIDMLGKIRGSEREREAAQPGDDMPGDNPIIAAAKEQLGLKFVPSKGTVETLVIDRAEKPGAN